MKLGKPLFASKGLSMCLAIASVLVTGAFVSADQPKQLHLAFITNNASDFWAIARAGTEKAVEETPNIDVNFQIPGDATAATQKRIIDDLVVKGLDGVTISPVDPTNETPMLNDLAKQCLVFCHDSDAPDSDRALYVGTNNEDAGKQAGQLLKEVLPDGGKIMLFVGNVDTQNAKDRIQGIHDVIDGTNISVVDVRTDDADPARARSNADDAIVAHPEVTCLVGLYSYNGPAILNAVKDANKVGQIKIVCFDEDQDVLNGIRDGSVYGTIVQQPYEFGRKAIELLATVLRGDKSVIPASKQIFIPTLAIKKDSVDDFQTKLNKILGK